MEASKLPGLKATKVLTSKPIVNSNSGAFPNQNERGRQTFLDEAVTTIILELKRRVLIFL
jgi:hypothetical protein